MEEKPFRISRAKTIEYLDVPHSSSTSVHVDKSANRDTPFITYHIIKMYEDNNGDFAEKCVAKIREIVE